MRSGLKKTIIGSILFLLLLFQVSFVSGGEQFRPEAPLHITSHYKIPMNPDLGTRVQWQVVPEMRSAGPALAYYTDGGQLFCRIHIGQDETLKTISLLDVNGNLMDHSLNSFMPVASFPAPCRIVDFSPETREGSFKISKSAGGRTFLEIYSYSIQPVSYDAAVEQKWIDPDFVTNEAASDLMILLVFTKDKQLLFRQVWQKDASWWLYEETATTRSWRR